MFKKPSKTDKVSAVSAAFSALFAGISLLSAFSSNRASQALEAERFAYEYPEPELDFEMPGLIDVYRVPAYWDDGFGIDQAVTTTLTVSGWATQPIVISSVRVEWVEWPGTPPNRWYQDLPVQVDWPETQAIHLTPSEANEIHATNELTFS